jgi:hypothetical protein
MDKRKTYSGTFKAKVVIEFLGGKIGPKNLQKNIRCIPNQIKNWKPSYSNGRTSYLLIEGRAIIHIL